MFHFKKPKFVSAKISSINYTEATIETELYWSTYADVKLVGINEGREHNEQVYLHVCSPAFAKSPKDEVVDEKTVVMDYLDKHKIENEITRYINEANAHKHISWKDYYKELSEHFDID
jgi:hypothetical protein